jgi:hypothetical protein
MKRIAFLFAVLLVGAAMALPRVAAAADQSLATGGAGGIYPPGSSFTGVDINGLQLGVGAEVNLDSSGLGDFTAILLGVSVLGAEQRITIEGQVTGGSRSAANIVVLSGAATLDLGDGSPPTPGVPFTATLTADGNSLGTVGLVIGVTNLPNATLNAGSLTIQ